jgi:hypothetical protein
VTGCANPSYFNVRDNIGPRQWSTVAVTPFSGDARFRQVATETFTLHMLGQSKLVIVEPSTVELKADQILMQATENGITILQAQKIGELLNADAVVTGTTTSYNNGVTLNGWATVRLIDTNTGEIIASSHRPSGLLFGWSEHQCVVKATERVAKDIVKVLKDIRIKKKQAKILNTTKTSLDLNRKGLI